MTDYFEMKLAEKADRLQAQLDLSVKAREIERSEYQADLAIVRSQLEKAKAVIGWVETWICNRDKISSLSDEWRRGYGRYTYGARRFEV